MSLKTIIRRWLGIEEPKKRVSATRAYTAPITMTYHDGESMKRVGTHYLPFDEKVHIPTHRSIEPVSSKASIKFRRYGKSPNDIFQFYHTCGGYPIFAKLMKHEQWYTVNKRTNDTKYPFVLIVFDRDSISKNGNPESRSFRVKSYEEGHRCALRLLDIHEVQERKRQN